MKQGFFPQNTSSLLRFPKIRKSTSGVWNLEYFFVPFYPENSYSKNHRIINDRTAFRPRGQVNESFFFLVIYTLNKWKMGRFCRPFRASKKVTLVISTSFLTQNFGHLRNLQIGNGGGGRRIRCKEKGNSHAEGFWHSRYEPRHTKKNSHLC